MRKILVCSLMFMSMTAFAELQPLDNQDLQQVQAQGGADISWQLTLNQNSSYAFNCANLVYCRLGLSLNNRYNDGSYVNRDTGQAYNAAGTPIPTTSLGKKLWLVFKGIQGSINLQQVKLDGTDITFNGNTQAAIQLSYDPLKPIQIRNFGYQALSIQTDSVANEGSGNVPGYLVPLTSGTGTYAAVSTEGTAGRFDGYDPNNPTMGRETGFTGLNLNGNLSLAGTVKIFSCGASHPRCVP